MADPVSAAALRLAQIREDIQRLIDRAIFEVGGSGGRRECRYCLRNSFAGQIEHHDGCLVMTLQGTLPLLAALARAEQTIREQHTEETPSREWLMRRVAFYAAECERQGEIIEGYQQAGADAVLAHLWDMAAKYDSPICNAIRDPIHLHYQRSRPAGSTAERCTGEVTVAGGTAVMIAPSELRLTFQGATIDTQRLRIVTAHLSDFCGEFVCVSQTGGDNSVESILFTNAEARYVLNVLSQIIAAWARPATGAPETSPTETE